MPRLDRRKRRGQKHLGEKFSPAFYTADDGEIRLDGQPVLSPNPLAARKNGIAMVHQELAFCPNLTGGGKFVPGQHAQPRRLV